VIVVGLLLEANMLSCPNCSNRVDKKTKFCLYCDAHIEDYLHAATSAGMYAAPSKTSSNLGVIPDAESEIAAARQQLVQRNWRFSLVPAVVLVILLLVLGWELLRQNMNTYEWPWTIALLGVAPAATLAGVFAGLLIAREQFARSMRPSLSWSCQFRRSDNLEDSAWIVHLLNFGPGPANIESIKYSLTITTDSGDIQKNDVSRREAVKLLKEVGLQEGRDYNLELITPGASLPVVKQRAEGVDFATFKAGALDSVRRLNFRVCVVDIMGDHHEKSLPSNAGLPDIIKQVRPGIMPNQSAFEEVPMSNEPVVNERVPENLDQAQEVLVERKDEVIVNPHVRAALDDKAILARDSQNVADSHDTFLAWTRSPV
jgi:hypothetical protein